MDQLAKTSHRLLGLFTLTGLIFSGLYALEAPAWLIILGAIPLGASLVATGLFVHRRLFPTMPVTPFQEPPKLWLWGIAGVVWITMAIILVPLDWWFLQVAILCMGLPIYLFIHHYQKYWPQMSSSFTLLWIWAILSAISIMVGLSELGPNSPFSIDDRSITFISIVSSHLFATALFIIILQFIPRNDYLPATISPPKHPQVIYQLRNAFNAAKVDPKSLYKEGQIFLSLAPQKQIWELMAYQLGAEEGMRKASQQKDNHHEKLLASIHRFKEKTKLNALAASIQGHHAYCLQCQYPAMQGYIQEKAFPYCPICGENEWLQLNVPNPIGHTGANGAVEKTEGNWWLPVWNFANSRPQLAWIQTLVLEPNPKYNVDWLAFWWVSQMLAGNPRLNKPMDWVMHEGVKLSGPTLAKMELAAEKGLIIVRPHNNEFQTAPETPLETNSLPQ